MKSPSDRCLLYYENLTLPSVIVITANMGCNRCRARISDVVSKMTGVHDFTVDIRNKQVIVKGDFKCHRKNECFHIETERGLNAFAAFFRALVGVACFNRSITG